MKNLFSNQSRKKEIIHLKNFLPLRMQEEIKKTFLSPFIAWYTDGPVWGKEYLFLDKTVIENKNVIDSVGFHHMIFYEGKQLSDHFSISNSILFFLEKNLNISITEILRIRARLTTQINGHNADKYCGPHVDFYGEPNYYSFVYYVHDTDGDTFIFDETTESIKTKSNALSNPKILERFKPKEGEGVFFNGNMFHSGNCPIKEDIRIIINFDFRIKE